jgi:hypothetical protein
MTKARHLPCQLSPPWSRERQEEADLEPPSSGSSINTFYWVAGGTWCHFSKPLRPSYSSDASASSRSEAALVLSRTDIAMGEFDVQRGLTW